MSEEKKKKEGLDDIWKEVTGEKETPEKTSKSSDIKPEKPTEESTPEQSTSTSAKSPTEETSKLQESSKPDTEKVEQPAREGLWGESAVESALPGKVEAPTVPSVPLAPATPTAPVPTAVETEKFDTSPDRGTSKRVYTIYALKGEGKTGLGLSFPGKISALSFDRKTIQVWEEMFERTERITVYDAIRYLNKSSGEMWLKSADITFQYINHLLNTEITKAEPDWILVDGMEILTKLLEMVMRYRNGLQPFQGIRNLNIWKERRMFIDQIHNACFKIAKKGVIYTTYTNKDKIHKDGQVADSKDIPKWIDAFMYYTDVVIRVRSKQVEDGREFIADVESSKTAKIRTGARVNITGTEGYKKLTGD